MCVFSCCITRRSTGRARWKFLEILPAKQQPILSSTERAPSSSAFPAGRERRCAAGMQGSAAGMTASPSGRRSTTVRWASSWSTGTATSSPTAMPSMQPCRPQWSICDSTILRCAAQRPFWATSRSQGFEARQTLGGVLTGPVSSQKTTLASQLRSACRSARQHCGLRWRASGKWPPCRSSQRLLGARQPGHGSRAGPPLTDCWRYLLFWSIHARQLRTRTQGGAQAVTAACRLPGGCKLK